MYIYAKFIFGIVCNKKLLKSQTFLTQMNILTFFPFLLFGKNKPGYTVRLMCDKVSYNSGYS